MSPAPLPSGLQPPPPRLRVAEFADYEQIHALEASHFQEHQPREDWLNFWQANPLWPRLRDRWPIGWVLEGPDRRIVGTLTNVPSLYRLGERELICANGRAWFVRPEYRGYALWVVAEYFGQPGVDLFINTTVGNLAQAGIGSFSARVPVGDWASTAFFVTNYRAFARRLLEKARLPRIGLLAFPLGGTLWLRDALVGPRRPSAATGVVIDCVRQFDERFDGFWRELLRLHPQRLLAVRDRAALTWHFARPLRRERLWIFTALRGGQLRAYALVKRQDLGEGLRRLRLVDFQSLDGEVDHLPALLRAALSRAATDGFDVLEQLGTGLPQMETFERLAPHRRGLDSWQYYYAATDAEIQRLLREPTAWAPSAYDGDASFE